MTPPATGDLPGSWLYRVDVEGGVPVLSSPGGPPWGRRECGDYVRGAELRSGGRWLRLEPAGASSLRPAYSQARQAKEQWVEVFDPAAPAGTPPLLSRVAGSEAPHLGR